MQGISGDYGNSRYGHSGIYVLYAVFYASEYSYSVVVTGSQLSIAHPVADALENCRCGIHMAASGCPGVFVAFNRKVMLGCRASKVRTMSFDAFEILIIRMWEKSVLWVCISEKRPCWKRRGFFRLQTAYSDNVFFAEIISGNKPGILEYLQAQGMQRSIY